MNSQGIVAKVQFEVQNKLVIADPCYVDLDDGPDAEHNDTLADNGVLLDDCQGIWIAEVDMSDEGDWGMRVKTLRLVRGRGNRLWSDIGTAGVDSGQMYAGDSSDTPLDYDALIEHYDNWPRNESPDIIEYGGGVISRTGYGDGGYGVYCQYDEEKKPAIIEVRFI